MRNSLVILLVSTVTVSACVGGPPRWADSEALQFERTYAEQQAGYSYIPIEPTSVRIDCMKIDCSGGPTKEHLLDSLPDNSVRIATRLISGKSTAGAPVFGADIGIEDNTYEVIIDFVNTQTINKRFIGKWYVSLPESVRAANRCYPFELSVLDLAPLQRYENWTLRAELFKNEEVYETKATRFREVDEKRPEVQRAAQRCPDGVKREADYQSFQISPEVFHVPVYVGIGLRLKATVTVLEGKVNLSSLPALTAAVSAGKATGSMSVQTIGINSKGARSNLLLLDKIDATTIQNAIQVLTSIKSSIESNDTVITPRIVGFHNTIGAGAQGVNLIHSLLASDTNGYLLVDRSAYAKDDAKR